MSRLILDKNSHDWGIDYIEKSLKELLDLDCEFRDRVANIVSNLKNAKRVFLNIGELEDE